MTPWLPKHSARVLETAQTGHRQYQNPKGNLPYLPPSHFSYPAVAVVRLPHPSYSSLVVAAHQHLQWTSEYVKRHKLESWTQEAQVRTACGAGGAGGEGCWSRPWAPATASGLFLVRVVPSASCIPSVLTYQSPNH